MSIGERVPMKKSFMENFRKFNFNVFLWRNYFSYASKHRLGHFLHENFRLADDMSVIIDFSESDALAANRRHVRKMKIMEKKNRYNSLNFIFSGTNYTSM